MNNLGLFSYGNLREIYNLDKDLYIEISKRYKKFFVIDISYLINFKKKIKQNFLPKNFIIFQPKNYYQLQKFLIKKKIIILLIGVNLLFIQLNS